MRIKRSTFCLLTLVCTLAGCTQTGGVRPGTGSEMRTVASVGDKPLPIVSGEPGASLRAETEELDLPESSGSRISGRVYDERGKAVPNAKVRLAVSSSPGGKIVNATTDRSGAFTLRGLRAGSSYAVIAEYHGDDGMMSGRAQAKAPQTDVRISLQPRDGASSQGHASIRPARPRVEPISNIDSADDESSDEARSAGKINSEDIEPPADDAASLPPRRNVKLSRASDDVTTSTVRAGWNVRQPSAARAGAAKGRSHDSNDDGVTPNRSSAAGESTSELDDDGPNPLPPALDTADAGSEPSAFLAEETPIKLARNTTSSAARKSRRTDSGSVARDDSRAIGIMEAPGEREPRSMPEDVLPGARVITPRSSAPIVVNETPDPNSPEASPPKSTRRSKPPTVSQSSDQRSDTDSPEAPESSDLGGAPSASVRPTWRELAHNRADVPLDESIRRTLSSLAIAAWLPLPA